MIEIPSIIDKTYKSCDEANKTYLLNNIAIRTLNGEFNYLFNLKCTTLKMFESELQRIYDRDKSMNEKLRSHNAIDSEIEREIIALKRRRRDEKKEILSKMNGLQDRCDDRIEKIWNDLRVRRDRVLKYEIDRDRERQR